MADIRIVRFLETVRLCRGLTASQLETLANMLQPQLVPAKAVLFREGDPGDGFYFIQEGEVGVYQKIPGAGQERLAVLGVGAPIGHLCLIDGEPRSATCTAHVRTVVLRGDKRSFERLFTEGDGLAFKFIDAIARDLSEKLRLTNQRLYDLYARPEETVIRLKQLARQVVESQERALERVEVVRPDNREQAPLRRVVLNVFR